MKKLIIILAVICIPFTVLGDKCDIENDTTIINSKKLVCNPVNRTVTKFKTNEPVVALENRVCKVTCNEEILFSIDPIKKVLAGMSFNYPLYASGIRKCSAKYNYKEYESEIQKLANEYANASGSDKTTIKNKIVNLQDEKKSCDEFTKKDSKKFNKYKFNKDAKVKAEIETTGDVKKYDYVFRDIDKEYDNKVIVDEINYLSCDYSEIEGKCKGSDKTINGWEETARIFGKFTFTDTYLNKYDGTIETTYSDKVCNSGDRFYTSFREYTKPIEGDTKDSGYKIKLKGINLGNNVVASKDNWNLDVECYYQVNNVIFPEGGTNKIEDENYKKYGSIGFQYRVVDVTNPFPERNPGANWKGKEEIITSKPYNTLITLEKFIIKLRRSSIKNVREYNSSHKYDTFNLNEMEKSQFIIDNPNMIERK